jgi:hypothetical protein
MNNGKPITGKLVGDPELLRENKAGTAGTTTTTGAPATTTASWTAHHTYLGTGPISYEDSISPEWYELEREAMLSDVGFVVRDPVHRTCVLGPALAATGFAALEERPAIDAVIEQAELLPAELTPRWAATRRGG